MRHDNIFRFSVDCRCAYETAPDGSAELTYWCPDCRAQKAERSSHNDRINFETDKPKTKTKEKQK